MLLLPISASLLFWYCIKSRSLNDLLRRITILALICISIIALPFALAIAILSIPYLLTFLLRNFAIKSVNRKFNIKTPPYSQFSNKITTANLTIYHSHNGSMDSFVRSWRADDKLVINDYQWKLIENYLQDIRLERQGLLSKEDAGNLEANIFSTCATVTAVIRLRQMSRIDYGKNTNNIFTRIINWLFP